MKRMWIIAGKEIIDNLRDRRTNLSSVFSALFTPFILFAMIIMGGQTFNMDPEEKKLILPVQGAQYAPDLIHFLRSNNVEIREAPAEPAGAIREGSLDVVLVIDPLYPQKFRKGEPAPLQLVLDTSRQSAMAAQERLRSLLMAYNGQVGNLRLLLRGVDPALLSPLAVGVQDLATPQSQALIFLNMMPFLLTLTIFTGGMGVVIDATAGERERGSLEPLLINPVRRSSIVLGKYLASLVYGLAVLVLVLFTFWAGFRFIPLEEMIGFPMVVDGSALFQIGLLLLPELLLASALQMLIASFTRSFKEAQTYLSLMPVFIGMPGIFTAFSSVRATAWKMLIPTYGQSLLINMYLRGETILPLYVILTVISTLALTIVLLWASIRLYEHDRILFGR